MGRKFVSVREGATQKVDDTVTKIDHFTVKLQTFNIWAPWGK